MKRYICAKMNIRDEANKYNELLYSLIEQAGLSYAIKSAGVYANSSQTLLVEVILTNKSYHGKKFKGKVRPSEAEQFINKIVQSVSAYVTEGELVSHDKAFVQKLYFGDLWVGYYQSTNSGRGQTWVHLTDDPNKAKRFRPKDKPAYVGRYLSDIFVPFEKFGYHALHLVEDDADARNFILKHINNDFHAYIDRNIDITSEMIPLSKATKLPSIVNDLKQILIQPASDSEYSEYAQSVSELVDAADQLVTSQDFIDLVIDSSKREEFYYYHVPLAFRDRFNELYTREEFGLSRSSFDYILYELSGSFEGIKKENCTPEVLSAKLNKAASDLI